MLVAVPVVAALGGLSLPVGTLPFESVLGQQPATYFRPIHLAWILVLGFTVYPIAEGQRSPARLFDLLAMIFVLWSSGRVLSFDYQSIDHLLSGLQAADFAAGLILIIACLEMARRSVGPVMMWVGLVFCSTAPLATCCLMFSPPKGSVLSVSCAFRCSPAQVYLVHH